MGILPVTHPDIEQFITCKKTEGKITNFNLSVSVTDAFMQAVADGMSLCPLPNGSEATNFFECTKSVPLKS